MDSFRNFLDNLYLNTRIKFNLLDEEENVIYCKLGGEVSETIKHKIKIQDKELYICLEKRYESNLKLISYIIADRYKETYCLKEKLITDLLNGKEVDVNLIEKDLCFLQRGVIILLVSVDKSKHEALEIVKQLYSEKDIISLVYEEDIIIIGEFEDVEEHAKSIRETIVSNLYCKCYVSFGSRVYKVKDIINAYKDSKESMMLGKRFRFKDEIFFYDKMLFEKIVFNIGASVKQELMNKFKDRFDTFDKELIDTIEEFANCGLNISDASRKLYIHRNTLIYRIEKIKKETGFDIRQFTDATVFIVSFLIWREKDHK